MAKAPQQQQDMGSFQDILNKKMGDIERPKPYPVGSYIAVIDGLAQFERRGQNQNPCAIVNLRLVQPLGDVNKVDLMDMGGIAGKTIRHTLWLTPDAEWRAKKFLAEDVGVENADAKGLGQGFNEAQNRQVLIQIKHRPAADGSQIFSEIAQTAHIDKAKEIGV